MLFRIICILIFLAVLFTGALVITTLMPLTGLGYPMILVLDMIAGGLWGIFAGSVAARLWLGFIR